MLLSQGFSPRLSEGVMLGHGAKLREMSDPTTDVAVKRLVKEREALEAKLALQREAVRWMEAILWSDDTDCRKQDSLEEVLAEMRVELDGRQDRAA